MAKYNLFEDFCFKYCQLELNSPKTCTVHNDTSYSFPTGRQGEGLRQAAGEPATQARPWQHENDEKGYARNEGYARHERTSLWKIPVSTKLN